MENIFCKISDLRTESDVEQKLITPILTQANPHGLDFKFHEFFTKNSIKKINITKGQKTNYFPDYIVKLHGLPLLIIEAKKPGENIENAFHEASLYAHAINFLYPKEINPCKYIVACNGNRLVAGMWESKSYLVDLDFSEMVVANDKWNDFLEIFNREKLANEAKSLQVKIRGNSIFKKPNLLLGGPRMQNAEIPTNEFGSTVMIDNRYIFNPKTQEQRDEIARNAYIATKKSRKQIEPIDRIIRSTLSPGLESIPNIEDTTSPLELLEKLKDRTKQIASDLFILVGNVGSGKSTFVDYLKEVVLSGELSKNIEWVYLDLNLAPSSKEEIYNWIKTQIIEILKLQNSDQDFNDPDTLRKIYRVEIEQFKKRNESLLTPEKLNEKISEKIESLIEDKDKTCSYLINYLCKSKGKTLLLVLDNSDKRKKEDQLLMFDVARWLQGQYKISIFLPIRDTTYDRYKNEPPLDTVIRDLVFRIDSPLLAEVIYRRIDYILEQMPYKKGTLSFSLPNSSFRVSYGRKELKEYLHCILLSLFQDTFFKKLISGIAGKDIRKGLTIFIDFCKSGHINAVHILKMRTQNGDWKLPSHVIMRTFLRGTRKYYLDGTTSVRNLFYSDINDDIPDPFIRISILEWLFSKKREKGPSGVLGFHPISNLVKYLIGLGHGEKRIITELEELIRAGCIITESYGVDYSEQTKIIENFDELITLSLAGNIHLDLLLNVDYLAACSEDVWYKNNEVAMRIMKRMTARNGLGHYTLQTVIENAEDMVTYLSEYHKNFFTQTKEFLALEPLFSPDEYQKVIETAKIHNNGMYIDYDTLVKKYPTGSVVDAMISAKVKIGLVVEFGLHEKAVAFVRMYSLSNTFTELEVGDWIKIRITNFNDEHKKFEAELIS